MANWQPVSMPRVGPEIEINECLMFAILADEQQAWLRGRNILPEPGCETVALDESTFWQFLFDTQPQELERYYDAGKRRRRAP